MSIAGMRQMPGEPVRRGRWLAGRTLRFDPAMLLWIGAAAVLAFMVLAPVLRLLISSFTSTDGTGFTVANYVAAYTSERRLIGLGNSLLYALAVMIVSIVFAVPIAWAIARTDMPMKGLIRATILGAFITPPYLGAIGWILLAGPNAGWLNLAWMRLTGAESGLVNVYT